MDFQEMRRVTRKLSVALECTYYISPDDPGLSYRELNEVAGRLGINRGQVSGCFANLGPKPLDNGRLVPNPEKLIGWVSLIGAELPDFIDDRAADFWVRTMMNATDEVGVAEATISKRATIARAEQEGLSSKAMAVFLAIESAIGRIAVKDDIVSLPRGRTVWESRSVQRQQYSLPMHTADDRLQIYELVQDAIGRRTDGQVSYQFEQKLPYGSEDDPFL